MVGIRAGRRRRRARARLRQRQSLPRAWLVIYVVLCAAGASLATGAGLLFQIPSGVRQAMLATSCQLIARPHKHPACQEWIREHLAHEAPRPVRS